jgi:NAD(P)-dependent dehydrogenase (short-subunit alcohol dehydrogenase family)
MRIDGKVAIVTGAAQGIGKAIVERYVAAGAKVVLADTQAEKGEAVAAALGENCLFAACDAGDKASVDGLVNRTIAHFGTVDIAVCNAGISHSADFLDLEEEQFDRVLRVNLKGPFLLGQAAARHMAKAGGGTIINMSSINAVVASPHIVPYVTSKGGLNALTRVMALGLARHNIRVNAIGPGSIDTEQLANIIGNDEEAYRKMMARTPLGRLGQPAEIAEIALFLATPSAGYITGQTIYADGGRLPLAYTVPVAG